MGRVIRPRSNDRKTFYICKKRRNKKVVKIVSGSKSGIKFVVQEDGDGGTMPMPSSSSFEPRLDFLQQCQQSPTSEESDDINSEPSDPIGSYKAKKQRRVEKWSEIFPKLLEIGTSVQYTLSTDVCVKCQQPGTGYYRCLDCNPTSVFCRDCLVEQHSFPHLHKFENFQNGTFMTFEIETPSWNRPDGHMCTSMYNQDIIILDEKGRPHKRSLTFCSCESKAETMMRSYLWPSSPKNPCLGFHFKLLEWMTALFLECQVSTIGFCEAVKAVASNHPKGEVDSQTINIYGILMNECLVQYRQYNYLVKHPFHVNPAIESGKECPACFENPQLVVSFDADFQLVRKASSGTSIGKPKQNDGFFIDQQEVDTYMNNYGNSTKTVNDKMECSDFQAGSLLRSKGKNKKLDETAVFGSTCRHEFPLHFFNLKHGERIGYSVFLLEKIIAENPDKKIHLMYDIACRLQNHLKAHGRQDLLDAVKLVIPIFHCYAHKLSCQVLFNPRRTPGIGLSDGECVERLWSYLGKLSNISKEMTPENRIDSLVLALIHYGEKITRKLAQHLATKLKRAEHLLLTTSQVLDETLNNLPGVTFENVEKLAEDEIKMHSSTKIPSDQAMYTPKESYCMNLKKYFSLNQSMLLTDNPVLKEDNKKQIKRIELEMVKFERQMKCSRWLVSSDDYIISIESANKKTYVARYEKIKALMVERTFFLQMMKKYARGQAVALRLGIQLKKINNRAKLEIKEYNSCCAEKIHPYPNHLTFESIKDQSSDVNANMSIDTKRLLIDLVETKKRCTEEIQMVTTEMQCTLHYYKHRHEQLVITYRELDVACEVEKSVLISEGLGIEYRLQQMMALYPPNIQKTVTGHILFFHEIVKVPSFFQNSDITHILGDISDELSLVAFENEPELCTEDEEEQGFE